MKAVVFTLGCKVNEVESASVMAELEKRGWEVSDKLSFADIYILNTCAVTREAEKKSRQAIVRMLKYNPNAYVYVCGCASEKNAAQFKSPNVRFVCGARQKSDVVSAIASDFGGGSCTCLGYPKHVKTRAFVKIEDGCNNFCSYCVIPYLRGRVKSRSPQDILGEIQNTPCPEAVLTGINISAYNGADGGLTALINSLSGIDKRIRLGSIECTVICDEFLTALKGLKDFAPQFHLSLQSGSTAVLKAMNRHYTREEYINKCRLIYSYFPDAAITTDIIAGFCGESEEDFKQSLSIIKEVGFSRVHAFAFSPREGTRAYLLKDTPSDVKKERLSRLLAAAKKAEEEYLDKRLGKVYSVIMEDFDGTYTQGYTPTYIKVYIPGRHFGTANVKLLSPFEEGSLGELTSPRNSDE